MRFSSFLVAALALSVAVSPAAAEVGTMIRTDDLKATPFIDGATAAHVEANQQVTVLERKGAWVQVQANGKTGWVRMLNLRLQAGSSPAPNQANMHSASLLHTNSSGRTVTTGIKGLGEEDLKNASVDPVQLAELATLSVPASDAESNARASGLVEHSVDYLDQKDGQQPDKKQDKKH